MILDLEDAVAPNRKEAARETVAGFLRSDKKAGLRRVNAPARPSSRGHRGGRGTNLAGLRLPKRNRRRPYAA